MSWLELDDRILEHPKFIRAVKLAGSEAVHLWLGFRAYCGQHLTDGFVPADMVDEVRGPRNQKKREAALSALLAAGLLKRREDGIQMHDYLQWSSSRDEVLDAREKARERKAKSRGGHGVTDDEPPADSHRVSQPSLSISSPNTKPDPKPDPVRVVFDVWRETHGHPMARLDAKRKGKIRARLGENFTPEQLCLAIKNAKTDKFLMGDNPHSRVYDGIETLLRDAAQVERLAALDPNGSGENGVIKWGE